MEEKKRAQSKWISGNSSDKCLKFPLWSSSIMSIQLNITAAFETLCIKNVDFLSSQVSSFFWMQLNSLLEWTLSFFFLSHQAPRAQILCKYDFAGKVSANQVLSVLIWQRYQCVFWLYFPCTFFWKTAFFLKSKPTYLYLCEACLLLTTVSLSCFSLLYLVFYLYLLLCFE